MPLIRAQPMNVEAWVRFQHSRRKFHICMGTLFVLGVFGVVQGFTPQAWWVLGAPIVAAVPFERFYRRVRAAQPERFRR
ncbi:MULTISPECIES: hypothetical protein [unclassified Streptomyces]|uniref:hypothetical protein n=1 Tax=unclassified Streptomyces TaxID=2593676 RepID=UPI002E18DBCD|nr:MULTISPECIES: hypothetical protein [unclassified Streptomyces]